MTGTTLTEIEQASRVEAEAQLADISTVFPNISETQVRILRAKISIAFSHGGSFAMECVRGERRRILGLHVD